MAWVVMAEAAALPAAVRIATATPALLSSTAGCSTVSTATAASGIARAWAVDAAQRPMRAKEKRMVEEGFGWKVVGSVVDVMSIVR